MSRVTVAIFLHPPADDPPLTTALRLAQARLAERHSALFARAGAEVVVDRVAEPFGQRFARLAGSAPGGLVVLGGGAVPLLGDRDAARLVDAAASDAPVALTNNRYSSDVCAISQPGLLPSLPALAGDNALPRWLGGAGWSVRELPGRDRLALDLDSPLDVALVSRAPGAPSGIRRAAVDSGLEIPRLDELRALAADASRELLVFGRSSSRTLSWLERHVPCRVRFLAEERGLRASMPVASASAAATRPPRATLGRLLALRGPHALAETIAELADAAVLDTRVLLGDRLGADEAGWPSPEDRFASDLLRHHAVLDPWLRALTVSAATSAAPILLGGHTLVAPGLQLLFNVPRRASAQPVTGGAHAR